jgi:hypothetical protein
MLRYWLFTWVNNILPDHFYIGQQTSIKDIYEKFHRKKKKRRKYESQFENYDNDYYYDEDEDMSDVSRWRIYLLMCAIKVASRSSHQSSTTIIDLIIQFYFSWKNTGGIYLKNT